MLNLKFGPKISHKCTKILKKSAPYQMEIVDINAQQRLGFSHHHDNFYVFQNENLFQSFLSTTKPDIKISRAIQQVTSVLFSLGTEYSHSRCNKGSINLPSPKGTCSCNARQIHALSQSWSLAFSLQAPVTPCNVRQKHRGGKTQPMGGDRNRGNDNRPEDRWNFSGLESSSSLKRKWEGTENGSHTFTCLHRGQGRRSRSWWKGNTYQRPGGGDPRCRETPEPQWTELSPE